MQDQEYEQLVKAIFRAKANIQLLSHPSVPENPHWHVTASSGIRRAEMLAEEMQRLSDLERLKSSHEELCELCSGQASSEGLEGQQLADRVKSLMANPTPAILARVRNAEKSIEPHAEKSIEPHEEVRQQQVRRKRTKNTLLERKKDVIAKACKQGLLGEDYCKYLDKHGAKLPDSLIKAGVNGYVCAWQCPASQKVIKHERYNYGMRSSSKKPTQSQSQP